MHKGRPVVTRAALMRETMVSRCVSEAWYGNRVHNGHPRPVLASGRSLYFDETTLLAWIHLQLDPAAAPPRIATAAPSTSMKTSASPGTWRDWQQPNTADLLVDSTTLPAGRLDRLPGLGRQTPRLTVSTRATNAHRWLYRRFPTSWPNPAMSWLPG